jgi:hypothetical protein
MPHKETIGPHLENIHFNGSNNQSGSYELQ